MMEINTSIPPPLPSVYLNSESAPNSHFDSSTCRKRSKKQVSNSPPKKRHELGTKSASQTELLAKIQPPSSRNFNLNSALNHFLKEKGIEQEKVPVMEKEVTVVTPPKLEEKVMVPSSARPDSEQDVTQALQKIKKLNKQYQRRQKRQKKENSDEGNGSSEENSSGSEKISETFTEPKKELPKLPERSHSFKINDLLNSSDQIPMQVSSVQNTPSEPLALSGVQTSMLPEDLSKALSSVNHPTQKVQYPIQNIKHTRSQSFPDLSPYVNASKGNNDSNSNNSSTPSILKQTRRTSFSEQEEERRKRVSFFFTGSQIMRLSEEDEEKANEEMTNASSSLENGEDGMRKLAEAAEREQALPQAE
jgi:hypothetical protein